VLQQTNNVISTLFRSGAGRKRFLVIPVTVLTLAAAAQSGPPNVDFQHAQAAVMRGDWDQAITMIRPLLDANPRDLKIINLMGLALTGKGHTAEANREFESALKIDPNFYAARKNLAINQVHLKQLPEAEANFKIVLTAVPNDPVSNMFAAELAFAHKGYAEAKSHLELAGPWLQRDARLRVVAAECDFHLGNAAAAIQELKGLSPSELDPASQFRAGYLLAQHDDYAAAVKFFEAVRTQYPESFDVRFNLALCYVQTKRFAEAIAILSDLRDNGQETSAVDNLLAEAQESSGHTQQAADLLREASKLAPEDERNYVDLANLCLAREAYDLALEVVRVGLHYLPHSNALVIERGVVYAQSGKLDLAEKDFQAASDADKDAVSVAMGLTYIQESEISRATALLRERARQYPDNAALQYLFAESLIKSGIHPGDPDFVKAQQALQQSVRLNSHFVYARVELARTYVQQGKIDEAIALLRAAIRIDPSKVQIYAQLGNALRRKGETAEAAAMFAKVRELNARTNGRFAALVKAGSDDSQAERVER
jgi:tetratricopeptide (TPR) repeat protein